MEVQKKKPGFEWRECVYMRVKESERNREHQNCFSTWTQVVLNETRHAVFLSRLRESASGSADRTCPDCGPV